MSQAVFSAVEHVGAYRRRWRSNYLRFFLALMGDDAAMRRSRLEALLEADVMFADAVPPRTSQYHDTIERLAACAGEHDSLVELDANYEAFLTWADGEMRRGGTGLSFSELALLHAPLSGPIESTYGPQRDLRVILAISSFDLDAANDLDDVDADAQNLRLRAWKYGKIVDAAIRSGLEELACAFLAFGLFTQAMLAKTSGLALDHASMTERLRRLDGRPGWPMIERALAVSRDIHGQFHARGLDLKWLTALAHNPVPVVAPARVHRDLAEARFHAAIGREAWMRLSTRTKSQLLDAECQYLACHLEFGTNLKNLGAIAVAYLIAVELEALAQFNQVLSSEAYAEYRKVGRTTEKPTCGTVLHLLGKDPRIPAAVSAAVATSGPAWSQDSSTRSLLRQAWTLRNEVAHGEGMDQHGLNHVRKLLLAPDGLLIALAKV